jgi:hypothetical protein
MSSWRCALELNSDRSVRSGSESALVDAVRRGADLRIGTDFRHNEHLEPGSDNSEVINEVSDFRATYLLEGRWVAGCMTLRMPIMPPEGFGPRASMSFFLYNQNGQQAIARPYLDGKAATGEPGPSKKSVMPDYHSAKYREQDSWDVDTNAPSANFIYDFEVFRYFVRDEWREVFSNSPDGTVASGSLDALREEFIKGAEVKVAIQGLCDNLGDASKPVMDHELFVQCGPCYYNTERRIFSAGSQPVVRIDPAIPLWYKSRNWDFGWLMPRSDGFVARWLCNPYTLGFTKSEGRYRVRWFAR